MEIGAATLRPVSLFYSYSHRDEAFRHELGNHLAFLRRGNLIAEWHDRMIGAGGDWRGEIDRNLSSADIVLLLVSADFLASDYCWGEELTKALRRHERGEARVIPVILRPCRWRSTPLAKLQAVPRDGKPVTDWLSRAAFDNVAAAIERIIEDQQQERLRMAEEGNREAEEERLRAEAKAAREDEVQRRHAEVEASRRDEEQRQRRAPAKMGASQAAAKPARQWRGGTLPRWLMGGAFFAVVSGVVGVVLLSEKSGEDTSAVADKPSTPTPVPTPSPKKPALKPGETFADCEKCPEMVVIPGGSFMMGSPTSEAERGSDEGPQRRVTIKPFAVGQHEVRFDEWDACVAARGCNGYKTL